MRGHSPNGRAKRAVVDETAVRRIRRLHAEGVPTRELADLYDLTPEAIRRINRWETWRWVSEEVPAGSTADSQARLLEQLGGSPGLQRLQEEAAKARGAEALLAELEEKKDE